MMLIVDRGLNAADQPVQLVRGAGIRHLDMNRAVPGVGTVVVQHQIVGALDLREADDRLADASGQLRVIPLAENLGNAYSREELLEKIWGYDDYYGDIRTVDVTVSRIRKKIEKDPAKPEYLMTKRGVGYYLCRR